MAKVDGIFQSPYQIPNWQNYLTAAINGEQKTQGKKPFTLGVQPAGGVYGPRRTGAVGGEVAKFQQDIEGNINLNPHTSYAQDGARGKGNGFAVTHGGKVLGHYGQSLFYTA